MSTNTYIQGGVETTIGISYDSSTKKVYIFVKDNYSGLWAKDSMVFPNGDLNTSNSLGFTLGAFGNNISNGLHDYYNGTIGKVIIYNYCLTNANFYGENAKLFDEPSYHSMPWKWSENFSSGFSIGNTSGEVTFPETGLYYLVLNIFQL